MEHSSAEGGHGLAIYQAYFGEAQRQQISPIAIPFDVAGNTGNDQREYELFRKIYSQRPRGGGPWGLVSSKFELKTMVPLADFYQFAAARLAEGADCVFINPMIGNEAMHLNVWEQWWVSNPDVTPLCAFLETVGPIHSNLPMGGESFAFCNYFVGTERFWQAYFAYVEAFSSALEQQFQQNTAVGQFYKSTGVYSRDAAVTTRPFIIERLLSSFLAAHPGMARAACAMPQEIYHAKFGLRLGEALWHLAGLKNRAIQMGDQALFEQWLALRGELFPQAMGIIMQLDDAIDLMVSPRFRPSLAGTGPVAGAAV